MSTPRPDPELREGTSAEEALRASEKRYQMLAEISPVGIMHADAQGNCTYVNRRAGELAGRDGAQLIGLGWRHIIHPEHRESWVRDWQNAVAKGERFEGQTRVVRPDGTELWALVQFCPERNDTGAVIGYVGTMTDITEHKQFEAGLRELNEALERRAAERGAAADQRARELAASEADLRRQTTILQLVLDSMNDGVVVRDTTGAMLLHNRAAERLLGEAMAQTRPGSGQIQGAVRDGLTDAPIRFDDLPASRAARGETIDNAEYLLRHSSRPEGVWLSVNATPLRDEQGTIRGGLSVFHDLTANKRAEQSLRRQTAILQSVLDSMNDGVIVRDEEANLLLSNPAAERIMGMPMTQDRPFFPNPAVEMRDGRTDQPLALEDAPHARIARGEIIQDLELFVTHAGRPSGIWLSLNAGPLTEGSAIKGGVVVFRDITAHKLAEQAQRQQTRILQSILNSMTDAVVVRDEHERLVLSNPAAEQLMSLPPRAERPLHGDVIDELRDGDTGRPITVDDLPSARVLRGEAVKGMSVFIRHAGRPEGVWLGFNATSLRDDAGALRGSVMVARDETSQKRAEQALRESEHHYRDLAESNRRLLMELHHRVRNNLTGLLGLVEIMRQRAPDVGAFAGAIEGRLLAMAHVHDVLAVAGWQSLDLRSLVQSLLGSVNTLARNNIAVIIDGPEASVSPRQAPPLAMVLAEWFTNSIKYGAHSSPSGQLRISWAVAPEDGHNVLKLRWKETGGPTVRREITPSLGTELVRSFVAMELRGRCELGFPPDGVDHTIEFAAE